ncbi:MAG: exodeoxyribonuclease III, partial [Acidobacteriota bacterium]|nr:exodeoxyribonuclease III [Acidobacteriota bacterium]
MKIATWNVNGIRARQGQLLDWLATEKPDIVCLQEIKASLDQLPFELRDVEGYWSYWHGEKGYSGVAVLFAKSLTNVFPSCSHPGFDFEQRIACATIASPLGEIMVASIYVPNGGKDYEAKLRFLDALDSFAAEAEREQRLVIFCGDLNVAREERDVHIKLRKLNQIGTRPDERGLLERVISHGLVDVGRTLDPDNHDLFTWWAP